jgi:K+-transporting ATPase ATPase C chain
MPTWIRQHLAALRALLVLTVITGIIYPLAVWGVSFLPGLHDKAEGSIVSSSDGKIKGSSLIGQQFVGKDGSPLKQYFQARPSNAGDPSNTSDPGDNPLFTGGSNLGPESARDILPDPKLVAANKPDPKAKNSLLTTVCSRSAAVATLESVNGQKVDGSRPFCTSGGVGAVLSVIGPREKNGHVEHPAKVISVNEECSADPKNPTKPFISTYKGVAVQCAEFQKDYSLGYQEGEIVPIRGNAPADPKVPADAVTADFSGLDPQISPAYAELQVPRIAQARGRSVEEVRKAIQDNESGRTLGFIGEPTVNVLKLNIELDKKYPLKG